MPRILPAARRRLVLALVLGFSLAGCGLKGDLFLPDPSVQAPTERGDVSNQSQGEPTGEPPTDGQDDSDGAT